MDPSAPLANKALVCISRGGRGKGECSRQPCQETELRAGKRGGQAKRLSGRKKGLAVGEEAAFSTPQRDPLNSSGLLHMGLLSHPFFSYTELRARWDVCVFMHAHVCCM